MQGVWRCIQRLDRKGVAWTQELAMKRVFELTCIHMGNGNRNELSMVVNLSPNSYLSTLHPRDAHP